MPDANIASGSGISQISYNWGTSSHLKALYTQSYTIFNSLQTIHQEAVQASAAKHGPVGAVIVPTVETIQYYHRISEHYARVIQDYIERTQSETDVDLASLQKWQAAQTILKLAEVLYYPKDGRGVSVVGEELLHWLNSFDIAPTTEEGQEIAQSAVPHKHPDYWDYVLRCVLRGFHTSAASVLKSLDSHDSPVVRRVAQKAAKLLSTLPRSTNFAMEHEFVAAHRSWLASVRKVISGLEQEMDEMEADGGNTEEIEDERLEYEAQFRCLLELMAGVKDRVFEACEDWKEAFGAWGTLVHPTLKRDDVPSTAAMIFDKFPVDATVSADVVQSYLVKGEVRKALQKSQSVDIWLSAHLGDLMDKVGLLDDDEEKHDQDFRQELLFKYAQSLLDEQGLWRISIDYLAVCGAEGRKKMSKVVLSVPVEPSRLGGDDLEDESEEEEVEQEEDGDDMMKNSTNISTMKQKRQTKRLDRAEQVLRACYEHGLELEARVVCKRMSTWLLDQGEYGLAIAYCVRASDSVLIRNIADRILEEYVTKGADAFNRIVDSFPTCLILPNGSFEEISNHSAREDGLDANRKILLSRRLAFLARFRDFHKLYAEEHWSAAAAVLVELITTEAAPERFVAVLLVDAIPLLEDHEAAWFDKAQTFELLRIVEKITNSVCMHPSMSEHFLGYLNQLLGVESTGTINIDAAKTEQRRTKASDKLDAVRLSLARNLARVGVMQIGIV